MPVQFKKTFNFWNEFKHWNTLQIFAVLLFSQINCFSQEIIWQSEAESGIITGSAEFVTSCGNASGSAFVRLNNEPGNSLELDSIDVPESGHFRLYIDYFYLGEVPVEIWTNHDSLGVWYFPAAAWCYHGPPARYAIDIFLDAGYNSLKFKTCNNKNAPFIDRLTLKRITKPEANIYTSANRILPDQSIQISAEIQEISPTDETVTISISGLAPSSYVLTDTVLIIPAGKNSAKALLSCTGTPIEHETEFMASITGVSNGLIIGSQDSIRISIVNRPATFYISGSSGKDTNNGKSPETPFQTLEKMNSVSLIPGDSVLFSTDDTLAGQLVIQHSGIGGSPIYYGSFGEGDKPVIDGANAPGGAFTSSVFIQNCNHIVLEGMEINNDREVSRPGFDDQQGYGIHVLNDGDQVMSDLHFTTLVIKDIYAVSIEGVEFNSVEVAGIFIHSARNYTPGKEKHVRDITIENCFITHTGKFGILCSHAGASEGTGNDSLNRNMNLVIRDNQFFETGGAGITLSRCYNALVENNIFERTGSDYDPRMVNRGSGAWFWKCMNVVAQYNSSLHVRGYLDSYGMHIDFGNRNVFFQYNYSEDSEGGFVEILGDNINSVYRYNISVNDGFREKIGNTIWISRFAGRNDDGVIYIPSDSSYIYNNTIFVNSQISPDISIKGKNSFIYNNIFYVTGGGTIGEKTDTTSYEGGSLHVANNLYSGQVNSDFTSLDTSPLSGDPDLKYPGTHYTSGYQLSEGSIAHKAGLPFEEPAFPMAGKGIFKNISRYTERDFFGNSVDLLNGPVNIGADNWNFSDTATNGIGRNSFLHGLTVYPNPASDHIHIEMSSPINQKLLLQVVDIAGREISATQLVVYQGYNTCQIKLPAHPDKHLLFLVVSNKKSRYLRKIIVN